jgi:hypothetical protein
MSRRAPIALRIPISRVRSRTETSMMFDPDPAHDQRIDAIPAAQRRVSPTDDTVEQLGPASPIAGRRRPRLSGCAATATGASICAREVHLVASATDTEMS